MTQRAAPKVSVLVPSYNHAAFVEEAVRSALAHHRHPLEVIVVDDGSRDDSVEILRAIDDPRLEVIAQENRGAHAAFGRTLDRARGEIVFLLNSDDAYAPERIDRFVERFDADPDLLALASWIEIVDGDGASLGTKHAWSDLPPWPPPLPGPSLGDLATEKGEPGLALLETNWVSTTSNLAFRRTPVEAAGLRFLELRYCHDWDFLLGLVELGLANGGRFDLVTEPLVRYRVHGENTIRERGTDSVSGQGAMRFEILWLLARRAGRLVDLYTNAGFDRVELEARLWRSLPRSGRESLLAQLLVLRGASPTPPAAYDRLLDPAHPFRRQAVASLQGPSLQETES